MYSTFQIGNCFAGEKLKRDKKTYTLHVTARKFPRRFILRNLYKYYTESNFINHFCECFLLAHHMLSKKKPVRKRYVKKKTTNKLKKVPLKIAIRFLCLYIHPLKNCTTHMKNLGVTYLIHSSFIERRER